MRLAKHPEIQEALARARDEKARIQAEATKLAIERSAITMERVAVELGRIGFANMADYADIFVNAADLGGWLKSLPREQAAALTGVWTGAQGQPRLTLGDKRAALMDIAKLFGWITERRENKVVDEFENMSNEEIEAWLDERAEQRVMARQRSHAARTPRRQRPDDGAGKASLIARWSGGEQTGPRPKWGDDRGM